LPTDWNSKIEIIKALFNKNVNPENFNKNNATKVHLDWETRLKFISDIYLREDVSVQSAAKQDTIIVDGQ